MPPDVRKNKIFLYKNEKNIKSMKLLDRKEGGEKNPGSIKYDAAGKMWQN